MLNNSDMPSSPVFRSDGFMARGNDGEKYRGLTKREHFSSLAPDNIPPWFFQVFAESDKNKPEYTWHREATNHQIGECGFTQDGEVAMYFAWRTYYADKLLSELSK